MIRIRIATDRICISTLKIDENSSKSRPTLDGTETTFRGAEGLLLHRRHSFAITAFTAHGTCEFSKGNQGWLPLANILAHALSRGLIPRPSMPSAIAPESKRRRRGSASLVRRPASTSALQRDP